MRCECASPEFALISAAVGYGCVKCGHPAVTHLRDGNGRTWFVPCTADAEVEADSAAVVPMAKRGSGVEVA